MSRGARKGWEPELVEHVAFYAAERGDPDLEELCDEVLAGVTEEEVLFSLIREDPDLSDWCAPDQHYRRRKLEAGDELAVEVAGPLCVQRPPMVCARAAYPPRCVLRSRRAARRRRLVPQEKTMQSPKPQPCPKPTRELLAPNDREIRDELVWRRRYPELGGAP